MHASCRRTQSQSVHPRSSHVRTAGHPAESASGCRCEALESRVLLAATLPQGFAESQYIAGFNTPVSMEFAPDGRLFVAEKAGTIRVVKNGKLLPTPFLSVRVDTFRERGLEGFAFDPNFQKNGYIYVYYTRADNAGANRLSRFTVDPKNPDRAAAGSEVVLLDNVPTPTGFHNGGSMHFGKDRMLYLGIGDGGSRSADAQNLSSLSGKILRLNVNAYPNIIPADNPFVNVSGARKEVYALGFRNPFTSAIDPVSGDLFVNDVGSDKYEEVNRVTAGGNYGWPNHEGPQPAQGYVSPIYSYARSPGGQAAVTGGSFYRATQFPKNYQGGYFFADYTQGWIKFLNPSNRNQVSNFASGADGPIDIDVGPDGSLYYLSAFGEGYSGENRPVMKISYVGNANRPPNAKASASVTSGPAPLTVKFSAAGSTDPDNDALTYSWNFGDNSAKATGRSVTHTFNANGTYNVVLTVTDARGASSTAQPIAITAGDSAPTAVISRPRNRAYYTAGQTINFAGYGTDRKDGKLPASAYDWKVVFHHLDHTHPFLESIPDVATGSFTIPTTGEFDPRQAYRIDLTVTDSDGLKDTTSIYLRPRKGTITLQSNIPGLTLYLDDQPQAQSTTFVGVTGMQRTLSAPRTQTLNGKTYRFVSWSDGQAAEHTITTPRKSATYTATYREVANRRRVRPAPADIAAAPSREQHRVIRTADLQSLLVSNFFSQKRIPDPLSRV